MSLSNPTGNRQAEAGAPAIVFRAGPGFVNPEKALKNPWLQFRGNTSSRVRDTQGVFLTCATASHGDASTLRSVLDSVIQKIEDHAAQQGFIGMDGRLGCFFEIQTNLFCKSQCPGRMHTLGKQFIEIKIARLERILAGIRSRKCEEILDDVGEPLS